MGYWGWRPLVFGIFISTWVVGCNIVTDHTSPSAAPSNYPDVTLTVGRLPTARVSRAPTRATSVRATVITPAPSTTYSSANPFLTYIVRADDTLAQIAAWFDVSVDAIRAANDPLITITPGQTLLIPVPLAVYPPTCYETRPDSLICLGRVENALAFPLESVVVDVHLLQADGTVSLEERSIIEQTSIPSGGSATYQALFTADWGDFTYADATVIGAVRGAEDRFVALQIEDTGVEPLDSRMVISATVINPGDQPTELLRAFVTLLDPFGSVIGYRVVSFESSVVLAADERFPLRVEFAPQTDEDNPELLLTVEARLIES